MSLNRLTTNANFNSLNNTENKLYRLDELAIKAFIRARKDLNFDLPHEHNAVIHRMIISTFSQEFLQCIADANPDKVCKLLNDCPELVVEARGTITSGSGYTYKNVTAIELVFLMDDNELMSGILLPIIQELPLDMINAAIIQLNNKIIEIEKQRENFKPYNFNFIFCIIEQDETLNSTGNPNEATQKLYQQFIKDFKPGNITQGNSSIKEQIQEGFRLYDLIYKKWENTRKGHLLEWYLINIIGHLQSLVEKCFEQECSQGINHIVALKPNKRRVEIGNYINEIPLNYRGSMDSSLVLGRDYFVDVIPPAPGCKWAKCATSGTFPERYAEYRRIDLEKYFETKKIQWKSIQLLLNNLVQKQPKKSR